MLQPQLTIAEQLFERLSYLKIAPQSVLDLNDGTDIFIQKLQAIYPNAKVEGLQLTQATETLSFETDTFDLVFSSMPLMPAQQSEQFIRALHGVMKEEGCLMFSSFGPDTFQEAPDFSKANAFIDMHDLGDILLGEHFSDPVVDMDKFTVNYSNQKGLLASLAGFASVELLSDLKVDALTYEVVYGHAWKQQVAPAHDEASISIDALRNTLLKQEGF